MRDINAVEFHKTLKANGLSPLDPARIDRDGTEWWVLPNGKHVARQIGAFSCPSSYYVEG